MASELISNVEFIRRYVYSMGERYSKFRGRGHVSFDGDSLIVTGKRIYPSVITILAFIIFIVAWYQMMVKGSQLSLTFWVLIFGLIWSGVIITHYLNEYVLLKKEILIIKWSQIDKFAIDAQKKIIAFSIEKNPDCSPIVFKTEDIDQIADRFRENVPDRERTSHGSNAIEQRYDEEANVMSNFLDRLLGNKK